MLRQELCPAQETSVSKTPTTPAVHFFGSRQAKSVRQAPMRRATKKDTSSETASTDSLAELPVRHRSHEDDKLFCDNDGLVAIVCSLPCMR